MRVAQLWRYPVKSLGGERVERVEVGEQGIAGDRDWGLLDQATGTVLTARREAPLLFASSRLLDGGAGVEILLPDGTPAPDDASLSAWLGRDVRLVRSGPGIHGTYENVVDFENEAASAWRSWEGPEGTFHDSARLTLL